MLGTQPWKRKRGEGEVLQTFMIGASVGLRCTGLGRTEVGA